MTHTSDIVRPPKALVDALAEIGSATASAELNRMGIRDAHLRGVTSRIPGKALAGPALTLQFMPIRRSSCIGMCCITRRQETSSWWMHAATWEAAYSAR